jgi:hypothetical protein
MKLEFYRSPTEVIPTFSLVFAASLIGLHTATFARPERLLISGNDHCLMESLRHNYYETVPSMQDQGEALKEFAEKLLGETEDSPQEVVEALNLHFWDLV